jgi:hypothetical protein
MRNGPAHIRVCLVARGYSETLHPTEILRDPVFVRSSLLTCAVLRTYGKRSRAGLSSDPQIELRSSSGMSSDPQNTVARPAPPTQTPTPQSFLPRSTAPSLALPLPARRRAAPWSPLPNSSRPSSRSSSRSSAPFLPEHRRSLPAPPPPLRGWWGFFFPAEAGKCEDATSSHTAMAGRHSPPHLATPAVVKLRRSSSSGEI